MFRMLKSYRIVFIKPNHGDGGAGIIRVKRKQGRYVVRYGSLRRVVSSGALYNTVRSFRNRADRYLIQRGVRLARYQGRIFDVRVYLQKPHAEWSISGMTARVAAPRLYVTNYQKGGHARPLGKVLKHLYRNKRKAMERIHQISALSLLIAETVQKRRPTRETGVDLGIDRSGRIWIIEANSKPGHMLFTQLPDKTMLRTIMRNKHLIRKLNP
ncbi:YheC/YheD family protein [Paenibacillus sp. P26]|nr:YheC/YheD family protein [Paenibacillus sp. P26]